MVPLSFAGHALVPLAEGALFWPERRALLVADLHLEKASWYAASGQMLPPYDSAATLDTLAASLSRTDAAEIWCLGDSFHDGGAAARMHASAIERLRALTAATQWTWVVGNHDPHPATGCGGTVVAEAELDGIVLRHEADPGDPRPEISGHFHPKLSVTQRGRTISRRCYVASATKLILPAFGAFAGGLDARDPAILAAAGRPASAYVASAGRLLRFPLAACG